MTTPKEPELKPCPRCRGNVRLNECGNRFYFDCDDCGAIDTVEWYEIKMKLVRDTWNTRQHNQEDEPNSEINRLTDKGDGNGST